MISNVAVVDANCGESNGRITVTATGGQPPLMYSINGGPPGASNVFSGLPAGEIPEPCAADPADAVRWLLRKVYYGNALRIIPRMPTGGVPRG